MTSYYIIILSFLSSHELQCSFLASKMFLCVWSIPGVKICHYLMDNQLVRRLAMNDNDLGHLQENVENVRFLMAGMVGVAAHVLGNFACNLLKMRKLLV